MQAIWMCIQLRSKSYVCILLYFTNDYIPFALMLVAGIGLVSFVSLCNHVQVVCVTGVLILFGFVCFIM